MHGLLFFMGFLCNLFTWPAHCGNLGTYVTKYYSFPFIVSFLKSRDVTDRGSYIVVNVLLAAQCANIFSYFQAETLNFPY
jgi:hypothetical protein